MLRPHLREALRRIGLRQQRLRRNVDLPWVAVEGAPVREGELDDFGERVDVVGRVVPECRKVAGLEHVQHLEQGRPLAPETAAIDVDAAEVRPQRRLDLGSEGREILHGHEAPVRPVIGNDPLGDVASVEGVARSLQPCGPVAGRRLFLIGHVAQRRREIPLAEDLPDPWRPSAWEVHGLARRPAPVAGDVCRDHLRHQRIHDEPLVRESDRGCGDLSEGHRPEARRAP